MKITGKNEQDTESPKSDAFSEKVLNVALVIDGPQHLGVGAQVAGIGTVDGHCPRHGAAV